MVKQNGEGLPKRMSYIMLLSIQNIQLLENSCSFSCQQSSRVGANLISVGQWFGSGGDLLLLRKPNEKTMNKVV